MIFINIFFTSSGRRGYLIKFFKKEINGEGLVHAGNSSCLSSAMYYADKSVLTPKIYDKNYIGFLLEYCIKNNIDVVIPLLDIDLLVLTKNKKLFASAGVRVIVSSKKVIEICNDKWNLYQFLKNNQFNTCETFIDLNNVFDCLENDTIKFPLIIKPRWGMGSISIYEVNNLEELTILYKKVKKEISSSYLKYESAADFEKCVLVQEKINGQEYGLDIINDLDGIYQNTIIKKKLAMRSGETDCAITVENEDLQAIGLKISKKLKHIGNMDADVFVNENGIFLLELNARFGGGYPFSHMAGVNLPKAIINWIRGNKIDSNTLKPKIGVLSQKNIELIRLINVK